MALYWLIASVRILVLTSVYPPLGYSGHDERCRQTVLALARRGHQVQVITSDYRLPPMGVEGEKGVFRELRLYAESGENAALGSVYSVTFSHERYNSESVDYRLRRFKPDFVYVWNMRGLSKSLLFRLENGRVPVVYDLHGDWLYEENFRKDPWFRWWFENSSKRSKWYQGMNRVLGRARRTLGLLPIGGLNKLKFEHGYIASNWLKGHLLSEGLSQVEALPVIYPCLDSSKLKPKTDYSTKKHFMWAGRLTESKGADIVVDAVALLKQRGVNVQLDLFGMGKPRERKAKRERIVAAGLDDCISMRGIRPGELSKYYSKYDALLYTNRFAEPFSMTVLEGMLSGLPCLIADVGGNAELIEDGNNGILFKAGDVAALADSIEAFLDRPDGGASLAQSQIERLQDEHSTDRFCETLEAFLQTRAIGSKAAQNESRSED